MTASFLSLFPYIRELQTEIKNCNSIIKELDFTIVEMKKELREREISQKRYLEKIETLEKKEKLEKIVKKLANTDFNKGVKNPC